MLNFSASNSFTQGLSSGARVRRSKIWFQWYLMTICLATSTWSNRWRGPSCDAACSAALGRNGHQTYAILSPSLVVTQTRSNQLAKRNTTKTPDRRQMPCILSATINFRFFIRMHIIYVHVYFLSTTFCHLDPAIYHLRCCPMFCVVTSSRAQSVDRRQQKLLHSFFRPPVSFTPALFDSLAFHLEVVYHFIRSKINAISRNDIKLTKFRLASFPSHFATFIHLESVCLFFLLFLVSGHSASICPFINSLICFIAFISLHQAMA